MGITPQPSVKTQIQKSLQSIVKLIIGLLREKEAFSWLKLTLNLINHQSSQLFPFNCKIKHRNRDWYRIETLVKLVGLLHRRQIYQICLINKFKINMNSREWQKLNQKLPLWRGHWQKEEDAQNVLWNLHVSISIQWKPLFKKLSSKRQIDISFIPKKISAKSQDQPYQVPPSVSKPSSAAMVSQWALT